MRRSAFDSSYSVRVEQYQDLDSRSELHYSAGASSQG